MITTIRGKLLVTFAGVICTLAALVGFALFALKDADTQLQTAAQQRVAQIEELGQLESTGLQLAVNVRDLAMNDDIKLQNGLLAESKRLKTDTKKLFDELRLLSASPQEAASLERLASEFDKIDKLLTKVTQDVDEGRFDEVKALVLEKVRPQQQLFATEMRKLVASVTTDTYERATAAKSRIGRSVIALVLGLLVVALGGATVAWRVSRSITRQLGGEPGDAVATAKAMALGDLSTRFAVRDGDGTSLMDALNEMQASLIDVVSRVREGSQTVASASAEIAQSNLDLSARTEHQASALQETSAAMEQLGATVRQNADNALEADQLATNAKRVATAGGDVVLRVVATMKGINDSSKRIADILGVIDSIAFQTNILALNAAVEAARAGEQGRGFAVVASEVRSLAQRSADAAKEIKSLISASVGRVEQGSLLVDEAGSTMEEVVSAIQRVTGIMGDISTASNEQSTGVAQIGEAVTQLDQATQQNAALVEQSAASAENLKAMADQLVDAVAVFKLPQLA